MPVCIIKVVKNDYGNSGEIQGGRALVPSKHLLEIVNLEIKIFDVFLQPIVIKFLIELVNKLMCF